MHHRLVLARSGKGLHRAISGHRERGRKLTLHRMTCNIVKNGLTLASTSMQVVVGPR